VLYRRLAVSLAVLGAAAAFAPQAVADDGPVAVPAAAADALALAEAVLTTTSPAATEEMASTSQEEVEEAEPESAEPALSDVDELVAELTEPPDAQAPASEAHSAPATPVAVPTSSPEAPAPAPAAPSTATEAPAQAPEAPAQAAEATANPVPTSVSAPATEAIGAVTQQVQPVNVNISLRFESPGDNGPVSQLNAALAGVVAEISAPSPSQTQYQPTESQYHAPSEPAGSAPAPEAPHAPGTQTDPASAPAEQWDWTWQWNCGDAIPPEIAIPGDSSLPIWNWNWEWNCGGNPDGSENSGSQLPTQYQATAMQYQPININVSIRVLSPGNDGPVTQMNIAQAKVGVTIHSSLPVISLPVVTPVPVTPPSSGGPAPAQTTSPTVFAPDAFASLMETFVGLATGLGVLPVEIAVDLECCATLVAAPSGLAADEGGLRRPEIAGLLGTADDNSSGGPVRGDTARASTGTTSVAPVSAEAIASLAPPQPAVEAAKRAKAQEQLKQAPHKAAPKDERAAALGYAGVSPLAAPDKSSKLFFLYLIPFAFALVDAARRVLGEQRPTAADPGRPEERPG
jgi:hypothetical protein